MRVRVPLVFAVLLAACNDAPGADDAASTSTTTGTDGTMTGSIGTTYTEPDACMSTEDCDGGMVCAAAYDPGTASRGTAACVDACVPVDDLTLWCLDDLACCEGLRCNTVDGLCRPWASDETTTSSTSEDTGTSAGTTMDDTTTTAGTEEDTSSESTPSTDDGGSTGTSESTGPTSG